MVTVSVSLSSSPLTCLVKTKPCHSFRTCGSSSNLVSSLNFPAILLSSRFPSYQRQPLQFSPNNAARLRRISASSEDVLPSDTPIENAQQIISNEDSGVSTVVSVLLFIAFIGLSILTIGVIYIAVTDFLQKREREKLDKEEAAKKKKKKSGKKGKVKARAGAGPRGFGQKIDEDYDDED
ncbi:uncharacterized protein LOC122087489 [Macadamia integrifolia]|uniref:uncharacterized protein LOC122087489 n=1 Tax=Macadamia integrifolia TaxID=60698 RepID=UPI001C4F6391|nr:uncharacterized protein LOC122087489 [Macadamia integrifolia]